MKQNIGFVPLFLAVLLTGCATPHGPVVTRVSLDKNKAAVFHAALLTLQEWGEDILTVDQAAGLLVTKTRQWAINENMTLNYRMTVLIKPSSKNSSEAQVNVAGEKYFSDGSAFGVNETDTDVRGIIEGILGGIQAKLESG